MPQISTVNHKFNDHLERARQALFDMREYLDDNLNSANVAQKDQIMSRFKQIFDIIYDIPFMSRLPGYPQDALFKMKKALRLLFVFNGYVKNRIDGRSFSMFKQIQDRLERSTFMAIKELGGMTVSNSSVDFAKAYEKILNKQHLMELLGKMRSEFAAVRMLTGNGNRVDRLDLSRISKARNKILLADKALLKAISSLSSLVAEATRMQAYNERDTYMGILSDVKSERAEIKNGIDKIYNKKIKEISEQKKSGYEKSLYGGKSGEFNRNAEFSERGRFGGLDIDSRSRLDRAIKRYIDKRVWAYVKNLSGILK